MRHVVRRRRVVRNPGGNHKAVLDGPVNAGADADGVGTFAVVGHKGVEIDHVFDAVGHAVGHAGDDHPAVAVADEHDVVQVFPHDDIDDVLDVRVEVNVGAGEMGPLALPRQRGAIDLVTVGGEQLVHVFPIPAAAPRAVDDDVGELFASDCGLRRRGRRTVRFASDEYGEAGQGQGQGEGEWLVDIILALNVAGWWHGGIRTVK